MTWDIQGGFTLALSPYHTPQYYYFSFQGMQEQSLGQIPGCPLPLCKK